MPSQKALQIKPYQKIDGSVHNRLHMLKLKAHEKRQSKAQEIVTGQWVSSYAASSAYLTRSCICMC